jgi:hypothetical protein
LVHKGAVEIAALPSTLPELAEGIWSAVAIVTPAMLTHVWNELK